MEILISDSRTISEVQRDFSRAFPFLKLEFFDAPYKEDKALPKSKMLTHDRKLAVCRKKHVDGKLEIAKDEKVKRFRNSSFGKHSVFPRRYFRKSGNLWIETSLTDSWTLEQQNREGLEMSSAHKNPYKEAEETDLTDRDKWE
jgi:hypothetical protein